MASDYLNDLTAEQRARAAKVKLLALDVDGTLSDGRLWFTSDGKEIKAFHVLDGQGMKLLRENNIEVALITARESPVVQARARELGLRHVYQGSRDKLESLSAAVELNGTSVLSHFASSSQTSRSSSCCHRSVVISSLNISRGGPA